MIYELIEFLILLTFGWGYIKPYLKPTMIISFTIAWFITNGWAYVLVFIPHGITWLTVVATAYVGILYLPVTPEKIVTIWIAVRIQRILFVKSTIGDKVKYDWWYKRRLKAYYSKYKGGML